MFFLVNHNAGGSTSTGGVSLETSLLSDMERLGLEVRRVEAEGQASVEELLESKRATRQDVQRLWDSVNDLQESSNATQRAMEEMYDKASHKRKKTHFYQAFVDRHF